MSLLAYSVRRLLLLVPTLLGVTALTFVLIRVLPGDPVATILGPTATPDEIEAARQRFGLDEPLLVQYWHYLGDLVARRLRHVDPDRAVGRATRCSTASARPSSW